MQRIPPHHRPYWYQANYRIIRIHTIPSAANMNNSIITGICISLFFVLYGLSLTQDANS